MPTDEGERGPRRIPRRRLIGTAAAAGLGLTATTLLGCERRVETVPPPRETRPAASPTAATPSPQPTPSIRRGGTWRIALASDPGTLDPLAGTGGNARTAGALAYSRLLAYESGPGRPRVSYLTAPDVAEFTQAPDAQTFIVRLNPRARFTAPIGRAVTSADVRASFERLVRTAPAAADPGALAMVAGVDTPDERTVIFRLKEPQGAFAHALADARGLMIMPSEASGFDPVRQTAGSGPFLLKSAEPGGALSYERNPEWHLGPDRPFLGGVELRVLRDAPAATAQFLAGALDALVVTPADVKRVREGVKGAVIEQMPPLHLQNITFSGLDVDPPWRDVRVRRAVSMAINRDAMLDEASGVKELRGQGLEVPYTWDGFLPWGIAGYTLEAKQLRAERQPWFRFNTSEASKLMDAAGWRDGFGVEWHYTGGFRGAYPLNARLVAQHLREIRVILRTTVEDFGEVYSRGTVPGNFRGMASIWQSLGEPGAYLSAMYLPASARNSGRINDPRLTDLVNAIQANTNREERRQQILDAQDYLAEQMYNVPLPNGPVLTAYHPSARNVAEYAAHGVAAAVDPISYYWKAQ